MGLGEPIRKRVGRPPRQNALQQLQTLNETCAASVFSRPLPMPETFESLLVKLSRAGVEFLVAGGVAVLKEGFTRETRRARDFADMKTNNSEQGALGWGLLWLLGVPIPILIILFLVRGCT